MDKAPAKLLLFGEYTILSGGEALSTPVAAYHGQWTDKTPTVPVQKIQGHLPKLAEDKRLRTLPWLNLDAFSDDLKHGFWIESNIPSGYGLGSSGMVTALLYNKYVSEKTDEPIALRAQLSEIESFFHGSSSGIDPLTIYLNRRLLISSADKPVQVLPATEAQPHPMHLYLLDSGRKRNTSELVELFKKGKVGSKDPEFDLQNIKNVTEQVLHGYLGKEAFASDFERNLRTLSMLQLQFFGHPFIPHDIGALWADGLHYGHYCIKLCGAGGGGFFQVWSKEPLGQTLGDYRLVEV